MGLSTCIICAGKGQITELLRPGRCQPYRAVLLPSVRMSSAACRIFTGGLVAALGSTAPEGRAGSRRNCRALDINARGGWNQGTVPVPRRSRRTSAPDLGWPKNLAEQVQVLPSQILGTGTSGVVVLGVERETGRHVAVKTLPKARAGIASSRMAEKIAEEVALLEEVQDCPSVIQLVGKWEDDENAYVVTELCQEGDLRYLSESIELSECEVAALGRDILVMLADCHAKNIAHLDVKPENFMVSTGRDGRKSVKAVDFGCGQVVKAGTLLTEKTGTPLYRAPEMYFKQYGLEADLWAVGMIIYQLICGQLCFWGDLQECTPQSLMQSVLHEDVKFDYPGWEAVSPEAVDLVSRLLKRDPSERISAEEALRHPWITMHCGPHQKQRAGALVGNVVPTPNMSGLRSATACCSSTA